jgi:hypothetical protein
MMMATLQDQYAAEAEALRKQNAVIRAERDTAAAQYDAARQATIKAGQSVSAETAAEIQATQTAEAERLRQSAASRRRLLMVFAGVGLLASVGVVVAISKQR